MTLHGLLLGFAVATLPPALAHRWRRAGCGALVLFLSVGWLAFWGGHLWAAARGHGWWAVGPVWVGTGLLVEVPIVALLTLLLGPTRAQAGGRQNP